MEEHNFIVEKFKDKFASPAWKDFIFEFFERSPYLQWHDGINTSMLLEMTDEELDVAEVLLIDSVKHGGMWPTAGLAVIKSKKSIPVLKDNLDRAPSVMRIRIAHALEQIEQTGKYVHILIEELLQKGSPYDQLEAAMNLKYYPREDVVDALYQGMQHADYLVRYHSAESLLYIYGFPPDIFQQRALFDDITTKKDGKKTTKANYQAAVQGMKALVRGRTYERYP